VHEKLIQNGKSMLHKTLSFTFVAYSINSFQFKEQFPKGKEKHFLINIAQSILLFST
jgi:hypothetical protein